MEFLPANAVLRSGTDKLLNSNTQIRGLLPPELLPNSTLDQKFIATPQISVMDSGNLADLSIMYNTEIINKQKLLENIFTILEEKQQVKLEKVVAIYPLTMGLAYNKVQCPSL